jgi:hypothetical protein
MAGLTSRARLTNGARLTRVAGLTNGTGLTRVGGLTSGVRLTNAARLWSLAGLTEIIKILVERNDRTSYFWPHTWAFISSKFKP